MPSNSQLSPTGSTIRKKKQNFKHGNVHSLGTEIEVETKGSLNIDIDDTQKTTSARLPNTFNGSSEVAIDSEAFSTADTQMRKITLARKTEAKVREVHAECARLIETDNQSSLKAYLS